MKKISAWSDSDLWESSKDRVRRISYIIYKLLPESVKYRFIYFVNGIVRAIITCR